MQQKGKHNSTLTPYARDLRKNMTKQELEDGIKWIWKETYKISNIFKRIAWNKPIVHALGVLVNIGYRKYAKKFDMFNDETMLDNSDIPEAAK